MSSTGPLSPLGAARSLLRGERRSGRPLGERGAFGDGGEGVRVADGEAEAAGRGGLWEIPEPPVRRGSGLRESEGRSGTGWGLGAVSRCLALPGSLSGALGVPRFSRPGATRRPVRRAAGSSRRPPPLWCANEARRATPCAERRRPPLYHPQGGRQGRREGHGPPWGRGDRERRPDRRGSPASPGRQSPLRPTPGTRPLWRPGTRRPPDRHRALRPPRAATSPSPMRADEVQHLSAPGTSPAFSNRGSPPQGMRVTSVEAGRAPATRGLPPGRRVERARNPRSAGVCASSFLVSRASAATSQHHTLPPLNYSKARFCPIWQGCGQFGRSLPRLTVRPTA